MILVPRKSHTIVSESGMNKRRVIVRVKWSQSRDAHFCRVLSRSSAKNFSYSGFYNSSSSRIDSEWVSW